MHVQFVEPAVIRLLLLDVCPNGFLISSHRGDKIPSGPKVLPREILLSPEERPRNVDGALPLDKTHHLCDRVFWRDADQHVDMVQHEMPFHNPALLLDGQFPEYLTQIFPEIFVQYLSSTFRNPYHMVLAVPYRVA